MKDYFSDLSVSYNNSNKMEKPATPSLENLVSTPIPIDLETTIVMSVIDITKESIRCFTEYSKCREHEKTERERISATLRTVQYQIDAQKEVYQKELENKFKERNHLYDLAEKALEKALELEDTEMLQLCYNFILNVYNKPYELNEAIVSLSGNSLNP